MGLHNGRAHVFMMHMYTCTCVWVRVHSNSRSVNHLMNGRTRTSRSGCLFVESVACLEI